VTLAKHRPTKPHFRVVSAAEYLVNTPGATLAGASKHCGLSLPRLRDLLKQPHNLAYVKQVRDLAVEALATSSPAVLAAVIEENSNQMATVAAVKTVLAQVRESEDRNRAAAATRNSPGLLIVLQAPDDERGMRIGPTGKRLAGARTILEPGARDPALIIEAEDEPDVPIDP
jgi:hypothetical protein